MINFYHCFIPGFADILHPLNDLLSAKESTKNVQWNDNAISAFVAIKEALANATLLSHPKPDAPTSIITDASDIAVGAVLQQYSWCLIVYFSKKLQPAETRYSTFDRELLVIYLAIKHFQHFIEGCTFHILTDHKPLTYALATHSDKHSPRQICHLDFISQFTSDIRHVKGVDNPAADALSRVETNALQVSQSQVLDFTEMAAAQPSDPDLQTPHPSLTLKEVPLPLSDKNIIYDVSTGTPRPFVPLKFRRPVFDSLHSLSHPGIRATQKLVTTRYVWPGINSDVRRWAKSCLQYQRTKVHRHTVTPLMRVATPDARFDNIHLDIVGPLLFLPAYLQ